MPFSLAVTPLRLAFRDPFRIARSLEDRFAETFIVELRPQAAARSSAASDAGDGPSGLGEAFPDPYFGENTVTVPALLPGLLAVAESVDEPRETAPEALLAWLERVSVAMDAHIGGHGAAKAAIDIALHDRAAKRAGLPLHALFGLPAELPPTDFTLGIDAPAVVAERAARAAHFPALKIKVGGPSDLETLEAVRAVYSGPIRVDANTGWQPEEGARLVPELVRLGVELIEQPFPRQQLAQLRWLQERSPLPIVADESAITIEDLDGLVGVVAGVNVKLMKCGGVGAAYRMLRRARELGFKLFLGCMEETSVGIAASAAVASLVDWVDLDGNLLLAADPYTGLELDDACRWRLPAAPGLGVSRRS